MPRDSVRKGRMPCRRKQVVWGASGFLVGSLGCSPGLTQKSPKNSRFWRHNRAKRMTAENGQKRLVRCQVVRMGVQASQNRIARETPIRACPGGSRFLHYPRTPRRTAPRRACPGGSPVCRLVHGRFVGKPAFLGQAQEGTMLSSACGSAETRAPPARGRRRQRHSSKAAPNSKLDGALDLFHSH